MSNMRMASPYQAQAGPRQYHLQDEFGNFEYAYANKDSEKMEKGNDVLVRGRYAYIMSDGVLRRVDYIADKSRSQDRIKRSVEPDLLQTRMTSFMDSSSLRDDTMVNPNVYNMMRQDMSNNMIQRNRMNQMSSQHMFDMMDRSSNMKDNNMMGQNMYSNMMAQDMSSNIMNRNMIGRDNMRNRMGQDMMEENIMGRDIMDQNAYSNMMGRDMSSNLLNRNMMGQDMLNRNMSSNM